MSETVALSMSRTVARGVAIGVGLAALSVAAHSLTQYEVHASNESPILELPRDLVLAPVAFVVGLAIAYAARGEPERGPVPSGRVLRRIFARCAVTALLLAVSDALLEGVIGPTFWNWGGLYAVRLVRPAICGACWGVTAGLVGGFEQAFRERPRSPVALLTVLVGASATAFVGLFATFLQSTYTSTMQEKGDPLQALHAVRACFDLETAGYCLRLVPPFAIFAIVRRFRMGVVRETLIGTSVSSVLACVYLYGQAYSGGQAFLGSIIDIFVIALVIPLGALIGDRLEGRNRRDS